MTWWYTIVSSWLVLHFFCDTHYFVRTFLYYCICRIFCKRIKFTEHSTIYGICLTTDVNLPTDHMNNARVLREFDFGRMEHAARSRILWEFLIRGGNFLLAGSTIRYRMALRMFSPYKVITKPVWWDEKSFYFDQRIVTITDGIVRAMAYTKVVTSINMIDFVKKNYPGTERPEPPEDLILWMRSQEINRRKMKNSYAETETVSGGHDLAKT